MYPPTSAAKRGPSAIVIAVIVVALSLSVVATALSGRALGRKAGYVPTVFNDTIAVNNIGKYSSAATGVTFTSPILATSILPSTGNLTIGNSTTTTILSGTTAATSLVFGSGSLALDTYESGTLSLTYSGPYTASVVVSTIKYLRIGKLVTVVFPQVQGTCSTFGTITAATFPVALQTNYQFETHVTITGDNFSPVNARAAFSISQVLFIVLGTAPTCSSGRIFINGFQTSWIMP